MKRAAPLFLAGLFGLGACSDLNPVDAARDALAPGTIKLNETAAHDFVPGQIIVRFRPGAARSEIAQANRARHKENMRLERMVILEVPVGEEVAIANNLSKNPNVEFAEPDFVMRLGPCEVSESCLIPDGSLFDRKWDLRNTGNVIGQTGMLADADMDWVEAFDFLGSNYSGAAVIAILDTGIRTTHQQFTGKILGGRRFLSDTLTLGTRNYTDDQGHGTHVAGIAAGRGGVGLTSVPGVAYGANIKLLVGKVCNSAGSCPSSATANGIVWAADNGANVINMSLGSFGGNPDGTGSAAQQAAMQYALGKESLPVCATGNDDNKVGNGYAGGIGYPARFPECMAVGATNWNDAKASYSNYGPQIEISAPGGDGNPLNTSNSLILAALHSSADNSYTYKAGTSMATPQVAGLAALLYAQGMTSAAAVRQRIIETADDIETQGWDNRTGAGRINVYRAITGKNPNAAPVASPANAPTGNKGVAMTFDGTASYDPNGKAIKSYAWNFGDPGSASNTATTAQASHTYMRAGSYTVSLTVVDAANLTSTTTSNVVIANIAPNISAFSGATLLQGESYAAAGSFADADPDQWMATVNYGDGTGVHPLALNGYSFALSHTYTVAGTHTVNVTVQDNDGGSGSGTATVTVWTPQQAIGATLLNAVAGLDQSSSLSAPLRAAQASLDRGSLSSANGQMRAFLNHVEAMVRSGNLPASTGAELTSAANRVLASMYR